MPKPPTSERGRPARVSVAPPPVPVRRPWLRRFVASAGPAPAAAGGRAVSGRDPGRHGPDGAAARSVDAAVASRRRPQLVEERAEDAASWAVELEGGADDAPGRLRRALDAFGWRALLATLLCLVGTGVSIYLTIAHYAHYSLACPANSTFNCEAVTHSPESFVFGIPVALLGLVFFVPMLGLCSPWAWRSANRFVAPLRLAAVVVGVGFVFYLVYAELFVIGNICIWCSSVHLITLLLFVLVATGWSDATAARLALAEQPDPEQL